MKYFATLVGAAALALTASGATAQEKFVTIGTGGQTGVYFVVGQSICKLVNRNQKDHGIKCTATSSGGSAAGTSG